MDVISPEDLITYESLVQEATCEYRDLVHSKQWEPSTSTEKSQYQPSLPKAYTVTIEHSFNEALDQVDSRIRRSGNGSGSGEDSYVKSNMTCRNYGKKGHIQRY